MPSEILEDSLNWEDRTKYVEVSDKPILVAVKFDRSKALPMIRKGEWGQILPPKFVIEGQGEANSTNSFTKSKRLKSKKERNWMWKEMK